jgi:hypothetical protein
MESVDIIDCELKASVLRDYRPYSTVVWCSKRIQYQLMMATNGGNCGRLVEDDVDTSGSHDGRGRNRKGRLASAGLSSDADLSRLLVGIACTKQAGRQ